MFGIYSLQPSNIQTRLNHISNKQSGGSYVGVFSMGAISGLVCSPCTTAPLSGALLYVAQSGDLLTGGMTLYALAIGMGVPLMIVTTFGNKFLPRTGVWMTQVKVLFGFILLAAPIFLLERILPSYLISLMWSSLGIATFGWLYHIKARFELGGLKQSVFGIVSIIGLFVSSQQLINQVTGVESAQVKSTEVKFKKVASIEDLDKQLLIAKKSGKKVMLDFYADWCVACKEYEKYTFNEPSIITTLEEFTLLQVDVTKNRPEEIELLKKMGVLGLPTIDFWDERGVQIEGARLTGFLEAEPFSEHLKSL
jgi:thiol:disulfide interchange protein DsbD